LQFISSQLPIRQQVKLETFLISLSFHLLVTARGKLYLLCNIWRNYS